MGEKANDVTDKELTTPKTDTQFTICGGNIWLSFFFSPAESFLGLKFYMHSKYVKQNRTAVVEKLSGLRLTYLIVPEISM